MSKIALKGGDTGTATYTLEAPTGTTDRTLTLPDEAGTVLTSASDYLSSTSNIVANSGSAFRAYSGAVSVTAGVNTKLTLNTTSFDAQSDFDTSNYHFVPPVDGYYILTLEVNGTSSSSYLYVRIYTDAGSTWVAAGVDTGVSGLIDPRPTTSCVAYLTTSDRPQAYVYSSTSQSAYARMTGALLRAA